MVRRSSIVGLLVALGLIAAAVYFLNSSLLFLVAILAVGIGGAIARSGKAGAVVGFLAVWIPTFALPLLLFLTLGDSDAGFAVIALVIVAIGLMIASFLLGALGALIGGIAGYLSGRNWPVDAKG